MTDRSVWMDRRAVSTTISYALNLALAAILISAVLFAGGSVVEDQRRSAIDDELTVIGQRLAATIHQTDRMGHLETPNGTNTTVNMSVNPPQTVAGAAYTVRINTTDEPMIILETQNPDVRVTVPIAVESDLAAVSVRGGPMVIVVRSDGVLEVQAP